MKEVFEREKTELFDIMNQQTQITNVLDPHQYRSKTITRDSNQCR